MTTLAKCSFWCVVLLAVTWIYTPVAMGQLAVNYTLEKDGPVSLAIYDSEGRMVRTLLSTAPQKAGEQKVDWDGLNSEGKPAAPGSYTWRLLQTEGIKAEYMLSLGTSVGINHWVGQHGGPNCVATDAEGVIVGGHPEGSPLMAKVKWDGTYAWPTAQIEPANGTHSIAVGNGTLYALMENGKLFTLDAKTGGYKKESYFLMQTVKKFGEMAETTELRKSFEAELPNGSYQAVVIAAAGEQSTPTLTVQFPQGSAEIGPIQPHKTGGVVAPQVYKVPICVPASNGKLSFAIVASSPEPWSLKEVEIRTPASRIDARGDELVACFTQANTVSWIDPKTGAVLKSATVPSPRDVTILGPGRVLVASQNSIIEVTSDGAPPQSKVSELGGPQFVAADASTGDVFVFEAKTNQVKRFDKSYQLLGTFGRAGGRKAGLYEPQDFFAVTDMTTDGKGGFVVVEPNAAPRRTAHFDRDGKVLNEWFGGQQFYTAAVPDPEDPTLVWMDSQWGWVMQVKVDWEKRSWTVRACYPWAQLLDGGLVSTGKMTTRLYPFHADLTGSGKRELYLWSDAHSALILKVDEEAGMLRPVSFMGRVLPGAGWEFDAVPAEQWPKSYQEAMELRGLDWTDSDVRNSHLGINWADVNGDGSVQAPELNINARGEFAHTPGCSWLDEKTLNIYSGTDYEQFAYWIRSPVGKTKIGSPIYDLASAIVKGPKMPFGSGNGIRLDADGHLYGVFTGGGDKYAEGLDSFHSHSGSWPGSLTDRTGLVKFNSKGEPVYTVGLKASAGQAYRGRMHNPTRIAGFVKSAAGKVLGVTDYYLVPCYFWSADDGLFIGTLLDGRVDDGLPQRVYSWWTAGTDDFNAKTGRALFQYDMLVGGQLIQLPNGDTIFMGAGWNNVPCFKIHGLDKLTRQEGKLELTAETTAYAKGEGKGLLGEYFDAHDLKRAESKISAIDREERERILDDEPAEQPGDEFRLNERDESPLLKRTNAQIWFGFPVNSKYVWESATTGSKPFSVRWTGSIEPRFTENYCLAFYYSGAIRLWIDDQLLLDNWTRAESARIFSKPVALQAGKKHKIRIEYTSTSSRVKKPEIHLVWESPSQGIEHVPAGFLYPE